MGEPGRVATPRKVGAEFTRRVLAALSTQRPMTTAEVAAVTNYSYGHTGTMLGLMARRGLVLQTGSPIPGRLYLWEPVRPDRECRCGHVGPETDFYPDRLRGGWYTGCKKCRKDRYVQARDRRRQAA